MTLYREGYYAFRKKMKERANMAEPTHKCLREGCTERVPASSETGYCEQHTFKPMYTLEEVEQLARQDDSSPEMYKCPYCQAWHMVQAKEFYCPLDPKARQA